MSYQITWEDKCVVCKHKGIVTAEEIDAATKEKYADPRIDNISYMIADASEVEQFLMLEDELGLVASQSIGASFYLKSDMKMAFIAVEKHTQRWCLSYIELMKSRQIPWEIRVFDNIKDARQWFIPEHNKTTSNKYTPHRFRLVFS